MQLKLLKNKSVNKNCCLPVDYNALFKTNINDAMNILCNYFCYKLKKQFFN